MRLLRWFKKDKNPDYKDENTSSNNTTEISLCKEYIHFLNGDFNLANEEFEIYKLYLLEGEYFYRNQVILILESRISNKKAICIKLPFSGKIEKVYNQEGRLISIHDKLLSVSKIENDDTIEGYLSQQSKRKCEKTEVVYYHDEFSDDKFIQIKKVGNEDTPYFKLYSHGTYYAHEYIGINFINKNGKPIIEIFSRNEEISLSKHDSLILLFEDNSKLNLTFENSGSGKKGFRYNQIAIGFEQLKTFLTKS